MSLSNPVIHKKKRGPPATGKTPLVALRLPGALSIQIDEWIAAQPEPRPSRSEAIRRLLADALGKPADAGSIAAIDAWIAAQPEPRASRPEAIRRLVAELLGKQETAARVELSAPATSKSEDLLRAAILALADEIASDPDDDGNDGYEARVRQVASSPSISQQSLVNFVDDVFRKNKSKAADRRRKK
jgi:Arc/MetJ-type ribon-helix-helix transcriptional regulator